MRDQVDPANAIAVARAGQPRPIHVTFRRTSMALALQGVLAGSTMLAMAAIAAPAHAQQSANARQPYAISAGTLDQVLMQLGRHSGVMLAADATLTAGLRSDGLRGDFTVEQALATVLAPHGLEAAAGANGGYRVRRLAPQADAGAPAPGIQALDTVQVFGTLEDGLNVGSKTGLSLRETPKSVTVMTRERLDAQNLTSLNGVMAQTTGVTVSAFGPIDNFFYSRGFRVTTFQLDGGAPAATGTAGAIINPDMAIYEHLEMLRGVDGMYSGAGDPGGVINLVRKRPADYFQAKVSVSAGRWENYRAEVDVGGPLTADGRLRGRSVLAYEDKHSFLDRYRPDKFVAYGILEYDLTDRLLVTFGANLQKEEHDKDPGWPGLMRYSDGGDLSLPRSTAFSTHWESTEYDNREYFFKAEQKFGETGVLKLNLTRMEQDQQYRDITVYGPIDRDTGLGASYWAGAGKGNVVQDLFDVSASGKFSLFGRQHRYTLGADHGKISNDGLTYFVPTAGSTASWPTTLDVFNWNPAAFSAPAWVRSTDYPDYSQTQRGFYGTIGLQLADALRLTVGGRYGEWEFYQQAVNYAEDGAVTSTALTAYKDEKFIPSAALSYDLGKQWTAYLSYGETFAVQSLYLSSSGQPLDPMTGTSWELGVKGVVGTSLNTAFAVFRVERDGQAMTDPAFPFTPGPSGSRCCYLPNATTISEGLDVEASGTVLPGLQLFAGYTYNRFDTKGDAGRYILNATPRHIFKAWGTWQLPGAYSAWNVNLGVVAQSKSFNSGEVYLDGDYMPYDFVQSGMGVWNASVQYRINDAWTVGLYGENLGDKVYYSSIGSIWYENNYATPRNYTLSLRGNW